MKSFKFYAFSLIIGLVLTIQSVSAQTTAFVYQGSLQTSGAPASGSYDFEFRLFDAVSAGTQLGTTQSANAVTVTNGVFTINLDFGNQFPGGGRFLEIRVRQTGGPTFTTLSPRSPVNSAPYSVKSLSADNATNATTATTANSLNCTGCVSASQIGSVNGSSITGTIPVASVPSESTSYVQNQQSVAQASTDFWISGRGSAGILNAGIQFQLSGFKVLSDAGNFNIFVGRGAGDSNTGSSNSFIGRDAGRINTSGSGNSFFGDRAGRFNRFSSNLTLIGKETDASGALSNATAIGSFAQVTADNSLVLGSINGLNSCIPANGCDSVKVGIGTTTPAARFHVADNNAQILFGGGGCLAGNFAIGFAATLTCTNYSILGDGSSTVMNRPLGGVIAFRENNITQMQLNAGGILSLNTLGSAGSTPLCRNASNEISTCSSSIRYKTNIAKFSDGMSFVNKLRPISFDWKDGGMKDVGFGAEDIAKIDSRFVTYNSAGEVEGVKYDRLSVAFVNAFKEQQAEISELRAVNGEQAKKIEGLNSKVKDQQSQIDALKKFVCSQYPAAELCATNEQK